MASLNLIYVILCLFICIKSQDGNSCTCYNGYDGPDEYKNEDGSCKYCSSCSQSGSDPPICSCGPESDCAGAYIGIGIGALSVLCVCCGFIYCGCKKCIEKRRTKQESKNDYLIMDIGDVNKQSGFTKNESNNLNKLEEGVTTR